MTKGQRRALFEACEPCRVCGGPKYTLRLTAAGEISEYCSPRCAAFSATYSRRKDAAREARREPYTRLEIFERDGWICWICGQEVDRESTGVSPAAPSIDHVVPLLAGGDDTPENVRCAHFECNKRRTDRKS